MVLVLLAMAVAFVIGLTFMATSTTTTGVAKTLTDHAQARQIAESGLTTAIRYLEGSAGWPDSLVEGDWVEDLSIMSGTVSISGSTTAAAAPAPVVIDNASFESQIGQLATPLLFPPMSGTIGGWEVERESLVGPLTGLTVPTLGVTSSPYATDGSNLTFIRFPASVAGAGRFSRTLTTTLEPGANYALTFDVSTGGLALLLATFEVRVYAGAELVASTADTSLLTVLNLNADIKEYVLQFTTDSDADPDEIRIELYAESLLGLLSAVTFDNLRLEMWPNSPVMLTAVGRYGRASHVVSAEVYMKGGGQPAGIVAWSEP